MIVAGVSGNFGRPEHDASAALVVDDKVIAAAEEERFVHYKSAIGLMPDRALAYCLDAADISIEEVDILAFPRSTWEGHDDRLRWWCRTTFGGIPRHIKFVDHHLAHAASSALTSPFREALCVSIDMTGDGISTSVYEWDVDKGFRSVESYRFPRSLGMVYATVTQFLGFKGTEEEGKVMALAQTGTPSVDLSNWLEVTPTGYEVNPEMFHGEVFKRYPEFHTRQLPYYSDDFAAAYPYRRLPGSAIHQEHRNLAASVQRFVNDAAASFIQGHLDQSSSHTLCLAGGVATNSVLNGHLARTLKVDNMHVPSAPGDAGTALGAALFVANETNGALYPLSSARLGPEPQEEAVIVRAELGGFRVRRVPPKDALEEALVRIQAQEVIALVQGRMEFGPRALGGRSLICHPNDRRAHSVLSSIKSRAPYRPFAPSVVDSVFQTIAPDHPDAPFMSYTVQLDNAGKQMLANATAADGTARAQVLRPADGLIFDVAAGLLGSGVAGAVVNTSLNTDGMPIDLDGLQALNILGSSALSALYLPNVVVDKGA